MLGLVLKQKIRMEEENTADGADASVFPQTPTRQAFRDTPTVLITAAQSLAACSCNPLILTELAGAQSFVSSRLCSRHLAVAFRGFAVIPVLGR